eukprot:jgi/Chlat1/1745/Chrsp13S02171
MAVDGDGGDAYALALELQLQELHAQRQLEQDAALALCLQLQPDDADPPYDCESAAEDAGAKDVTSSGCSVAPTLQLSECNEALSLLDEQIQALSQVQQAIKDSELFPSMSGGFMAILIPDQYRLEAKKLETCHPSLPLDIAAVPKCSTSARASSAGGCKHNICSMCVAEYIRIELDEHKYPITCAHPGCKWAFGLEDVNKVIRHDAKRLALVQRLAVEAGMKNRVYCPHAQCEAVMDIPNPKSKTDCFNCHRPFCATCQTAWHAGYSCEEYQALPDHSRTAEDLQVLRLAQQKLWRRCPNCKHMVERNLDGCNFMMCRCKSAFCYQCGVAYINLDANANNQHGRPGCQCGLFDRPPPDPQALEDDDGAGNADAHNVLVDLRQRVRRYNRMCRYGNLDACRYGMHRCWFRHEDEPDV